MVALCDAIIINEIMYNPEICSDYDLEWIELFNEDNMSVNLSGWKINNNGFEDALIGSNDYLVVARELTNAYDLADNCSFESIYGNNDSLWDGFDNFSAVDGSFSLNNDGGTIILYDEYENIIQNLSYLNNAKEGYSLERFNGTFYESKELGGTPGKINSINITDIEDKLGNESNDTLVDCEIPGVELFFDERNFTPNEELFLEWNISGLCEYENYNLSLKIARDIDILENGTNWKYLWYLFEDSTINTENKTDSVTSNMTFRLPEFSIKGDYKVLASLKYSKNNESHYKYASKYFYLDGLEDLGENKLLMLDVTKSQRFGDMAIVWAEFHSNNYFYENLTLVSYIYSPKWITNDLEGNILRTSPQKQDVAMRLYNVSRGKNFTFGLPLIIKNNCDSAFSDGNYKAKIKAFSGDEELNVIDYNITIKGNNDALCKEECKVCSSSKTVVAAPMSGSSDNPELFNYDKVRFLVEYPKEFFADEKIKVIIYANNSEDKDKKMFIRAYLYNKNKAITANDERYDIELEPFENEKKEIIVKLDPDDMNISKEYRLMVKINSTALKTEKSVNYPVRIMKNKNRIISAKLESEYEGVYLEVICEQKNEDIINIEWFGGKTRSKCNEDKMIIEQADNYFIFLTDKDNNIMDIIKKQVEQKTAKETISPMNAINDQNQNISSKSKDNLITGKVNAVIYESDNQKLKSLINYLLLTVFIILLVILFRKDEGIKNEG